MIFSCDRTGFPLVTLKSGIEMQLLPVTKVQFESFRSESNEITDEAYQELVALNPSVSHNQFISDQRERLFITAILPQEALAFARWMGNKFDLPTVDEWRTIYDELSLDISSLDGLEDIASQCQSEDAAIIVQQLLKQLKPISLLDLCLMKGAVVEWVRQGKTFVGLGAPRASFQPNLFNPLTDVAKPIQLEERIRYFGFRLIRRIV